MRGPEGFCDGLRAVLLIEGTHAAPMPIGVRVFGQCGGDIAGRGGGEGGVVGGDKCFFRLKISHLV
jgi:hypothetical protein